MRATTNPMIGRRIASGARREAAWALLISRATQALRWGGEGSKMLRYVCSDQCAASGERCSKSRISARSAAVAGAIGENAMVLSPSNPLPRLGEAFPKQARLGSQNVVGL
jgi:hypothetical protein